VAGLNDDDERLDPWDPTGHTHDIEIPTAPSAGLFVTCGPTAGSSFAVGHVTRLGRSVDCDVVFDEISVSRHHAVITADHGGYNIADLGSMNGTYLNGERIDGRAALQSGDQLRVGRFCITFTAL
jgi:predicted component of type VI protein secretion system